MYQFKNDILQKFASKSGQIAVLIDPEKTNKTEQILPLIKKATFAQIDYFFVGGSTVSRLDIENTVEILKQYTSIPVILFPGASHQLSQKADALLYLSLVSGRNPDFLIGQHIQSAQEILQLPLEVIPTAYILVDGGSKSSVSYVSQTTPIPPNQKSIAHSTALAAVFQGKKVVYFDAGSGANHPVPFEFISQLKQTIETVTIVGGGIRDMETIQLFSKAGANVIVIGNHIEQNSDFLLDLYAFKTKKSENITSH